MKVACLYFYLTSILSGHVTAQSCDLFDIAPVFGKVYMHKVRSSVTSLKTIACLLATQKLKLRPCNKWPVFSVNFFVIL